MSSEQLQQARAQRLTATHGRVLACVPAPSGDPRWKCIQRAAVGAAEWVRQGGGRTWPVAAYRAQVGLPTLG
ncbi:hypothetical protein E7T09_01090 [Deinococcus sp. KSM4-11]|nr:hypothetical protein E7T09_01090 [Deinococcus sp. KSM4-11]